MNTENTVVTKEKRSFNPRKFLASFQDRIASSPYSYLAYCFIIPVLLMYLVYLTFGIHPFGDGSVLVLDMNAQYVYFFEGLRNIIYGDGSMLYTFFRGLGGEFMGMYAYYLASPLSYIVALFPQENMLDAMLVIILIKVGLCGTTFGFYLHKHSKEVNKIVVVIFSIMYALCSYAVVFQENTMWMDALIWLPILTYSIEELVRNGRYKLFVVALSMTIMSNFYIGYMCCFYVALYYFYYIFSNKREDLNPHGRKLNLTRSFVRIAVFSIISIAISAFIILGAYYALTFGKTEFTTPKWDLKQKFEIIDFLTKFLPGAYDTVEPSGLPNVYCGILTLLLVPVYFVSKRIQSREKIASLIFIGIFVLSFIASPLDLIWHGFQAPNWLNYRYSFMLSFILLLLAYKGFGNLREVGEKFLLGVSAFLILFVTVCAKLDLPTYLESKGLLDLETVWLTVLATVSLLTVLCLFVRKKGSFRAENLAAVLAIIVCIEVFCSSMTFIHQHKKDVGGYIGTAGHKNYTEFLENIRPIVNDVKEYDNGFYRMESLVHRSINDNMALGIHGVSNSTSTLNSETIAFLKSLGYSARSHRSVYYGGNPVSDSIVGIKYILDNSSSNKLTDVYDKVLSDEKYAAYYNPYALSIAFGVDSSISKYNAANYSSHFERLNSLVQRMLGTKEYGNVFIAVDRKTIETYVSPNCTQTGNSHTVTYTPSKDKGDAYVSYTFTADKDGQYFFHTPASSAKETTLYVNGKSLGAYLGSNTNNIVFLGCFNAGDVVTVKIALKKDPISLYTYYDYIWYIDNESFENSFNTLLSNPQFIIDEYTEDNLIGTISTSKNAQTIMTTIPYDEGWKVYLDGEEIEIYKTVDALIAFDIENAGEHTLEFKYDPEIYKLGKAVSLIGIGIFALLCVLDLIFYFIFRKKRADLYSVKSDFWVLEDISADFELPPPTDEKKNKKLKDRLLGIKEKITNRKNKVEETPENPEESLSENPNDNASSSPDDND